MYPVSQPALGQLDVSPPMSQPGELASTMVLRGAVGTLVGAAVAPRGREGLWGAIGFVTGSLLGQYGIVAVAAYALWRKTQV